MLLNDLNHQLNTQEIRQKKIVLESKPIALIAHITEKCNLTCPMCNVRKKHREISDKTLNEILHLIPYLRHACWLGGEVFLYPHFKKLLDETHKYSNMSQSIYTNGLLLDSYWMDELIKGNKELIFSIDGVTKKVYEKVRRGAKFEDLLEKLELVNKYKNKTKFKLDITISVVVMKSNYTQLNKFIEFASKYKVCKIEFGPYIGDDRQENIFKYNDTKAIEYIKGSMQNLENQAKEHDIVLFDRLPYKNMVCDKDKTENFDEGLFCTIPWTFLYIMPGGKVIPHGSCKNIIGNVEEESIMDIWNSEQMQKYRKKIADKSFDDFCGLNTHWMELI